MKHRVLPLILAVTGLFVMLTAVFSFSAEFDHSHQRFTKVLEKFCKDGFVDYAELQNDPKDLRDYNDAMGAVTREEYEAWTREQQLAFLINVYNARVLSVVIEYYPIESIKDLWFPWKMKAARLFGRKVTLDRIENRMIRPNFKDPRVIFALNSSAVSSPKLRNEAYTAEKLDQQLDDQIKAYVNDEKMNRVNFYSHQLYLSRIFKWFRKDFKKESGSVIEFVKPYLDQEVRARIEKGNYQMGYTPYDWTLNDQFLLGNQS